MIIFAALAIMIIEDSSGHAKSSCLLCSLRENKTGLLVWYCDIGLLPNSNPVFVT